MGSECDDFDIYLASRSPRRRELLEQVAIRYRLVDSEIPEIPEVGEKPVDFVLRMAREKAHAGKGLIDSCQDKPVLGADTAVVVNNEILGKPNDRQHGLDMLALLSGKTHQVMTAVALLHADEIKTEVNISQVTFRKLSQGEGEDYWRTGEPVDKAGAYAIQGRAAMFIANLEGSYSGVVGLPLFETIKLLKECGIKP